MSYLPSLVAAAAALISAFSVPLQDMIAAHPAIAAILSGVGAIIAHLLPSPLKK